MNGTVKAERTAHAAKKRKPVVWSEEAFDVRRSTIRGAGMGLFARERILPGDTIGYYTGRVLTDEEANRRPYVDSKYLVWVCRDHWIWGEGRGSGYTRFINHDDRKPNAELITSTRWKTARIAAVRPIRPGEEIFFDYGEEYWEVIGDSKRDRPE